MQLWRAYFDSQKTPGTDLEQDTYATVRVNCYLSSHMVHCSWNGPALLLHRFLSGFLSFFYKTEFHYAALGGLGLTENCLSLSPECWGLKACVTISGFYLYFCVLYWSPPLFF